MCTQTCSLSLNNTGVENCPSIFSATTGFFLVPLVAEDGTTNKVNLASLVANPATYISGLINQSDATKRWYPVQDIKDITNERAEATFQEFSDGSKFYVKQGVRTFTGFKPKVSSTWVGKLDNNRCAPDYGLFFITKTLDLVGKRISGDVDYLYPVQIAKQTFVAQFTPQTETTVQGATISFEFDLSEKDADLAMITATTLSPVRLNSYNGLVDVVSTVSGESTTGFTIALGVVGGNFVTNVPVTGLVVGDLALYNVTDSASITPTSLTETSDGTYVVVMPAQTSADVVRATFTKNGYDFTSVTANTVLIP